MDIKKAIIDSIKYFRETFKLIIELLNSIIEERNVSTIK